MNDGDILLYLDAGFELNINGKKKFMEYIDIMDNNKGVLSFHLSNLKEKYYSNDALFKYFNILPSDTIYDSNQIVGGCLLFRKNNLSQQLINDFFDIALKRPDLFSDIYNLETTRSDFIDHRHDQSIFSVLKKTYGLSAIEDETYNQDFNLMGEYPFLAKRIKDKSSFFHKIKSSIKRYLL